MNFVRVGNRFINLDLVTDVRYYPARPFKGEDHDKPTMTEARCDVYLAATEGGSEGEDSNQWDTQRASIPLKGHEADDFAAWLDNNATDVVGESQVVRD